MPANTDFVRRMCQDDLDMVRSWRNHPDVRKFMYKNHEISAEEHSAWFSKAKCDPKRHLLVYEHQNQATGFINLHQVADGGIADWGFYLAPDAKPGTGAKMGLCALDYAFTTAGFHKICGQAIAYNERSSNFHLKLNFRKEGILREQHFDGSRYHDVICFGLLKDEWDKNKVALL
ncbi:UDP-4-amino-4,6-dideoxy-N-acetyl-beta-L-altrosamine N-acetyltransferase [Parasphingorhabdus sp.]|uniref:UDP-4-amino-4, 6-dideoxy-N-acetyl-beta-L-altrosamine N-acetyltransferase n=1 Tax=Parasphingorhabdus sp. TaxID=2709688 RepID=UPI002F9459FD